MLPQKAIQTCETLLDQHPESPLRVEARYPIAKERLRLGERARTLKEIDKLFQEHPGLLLLRRAQREMANLQEDGSPITDAAMAGNLP